MKITEVKIRKLLNEEKAKAVVSVVFDNDFAVHDMKIIQREDGSLFVAMPYRKTSSGKQIDIVHPTNAQLRQTIEAAVLAKYREYALTNILK